VRHHIVQTKTPRPAPFAAAGRQDRILTRGGPPLAASDTSRIRAILGPTNTGKTHLAVERMLAHGTGMIGLPLRLLAREIYDRMVRQKGARACGLITGEERIRPPTARYLACTVEAMPVTEGADFVAIDEIQLAQDPDRGHVFTDRILRARGRHETMLMGADTMRPALERLDLHIDSERRERFSRLHYSGPVKITKLPKRSAVVAFSAEEVYAIAELLKRQRGGCAVIMGALSPRTRNAQLDLYQSGEVDYIVATDAIGMGLNLDVGHIAFASRRKFDGRQRRYLRPDELAQIAGRAGRFRDDGAFGETGDCTPFEEETVDRIVNHQFEPLDYLNWRNSDLDYDSIDSLLASLRTPSPDVILRRGPEALDELTLAAVAPNADLRRAVRTPAHVRRLWELCSLPDFRKYGPDAHMRLVQGLIERLIEPSARIKDEWMYEQVEPLDRIEGDVDTLQQRLAAIRTWTYAANRSDWLDNAQTWIGRTREIEDRLSDALHQALMLRFVDRRTSALLRSLNAEEDAAADIGPAGDVSVGGHIVGRLEGLVFSALASDGSLSGRALRGAAVRAIRPIIEQRLTAIIHAGDDQLAFEPMQAVVTFGGAPVAKLVAGAEWHSPRLELLGARDALAPAREMALNRLTGWFGKYLKSQLPQLHSLIDRLGASGGLRGAARGAAYQLLEAGAVLDGRKGRSGIQLSGPDRAALSAAGVRAGRIAAWLPDLLKPAAARLTLSLRSVHSGQVAPETPTQSSFSLKEGDWSDTMLHTAGYLRLGARAIRVDLADRLAGALFRIRRASDTSAFAVPADLCAQVGCPQADFADVLRALGLRVVERDKQTQAISLWRFPSHRSGRELSKGADAGSASDGRSSGPGVGTAPRRFQQTASPAGPFAALADLIVLQPDPAAAVGRRRKRRPRRPSAAASRPMTDSEHD